MMGTEPRGRALRTCRVVTAEHLLTKPPAPELPDAHGNQQRIFKKLKKRKSCFCGVSQTFETAARGDCETGHEQHPEGT